MYAVIEQTGVTEGTRRWAEWDGELIVIHQTEKGAETAAVEVAKRLGMPEGANPGVWGNISARRLDRIPVYATTAD